jgi:hypothetical protein
MTNYDELVQRLTAPDKHAYWPAVALRHAAADAIVQLQARVAELEARTEQLQVQLAGCGVAALQNTRQSIAEQRIGSDQYGFSASYMEVCTAVDREIEQRERAERAEADLLTMRQRHDNCAASNRLHTQEKLVLQADLAAARAENDAMIATLPGTYYMDPPDGGSVMPEEQMRRMADDAKRYRQAEADLAAARATEKQLRHLLFLAHGNAEHYLYGDDGERQCNTCMIDFNVDTPREIEQKITDYWNRKYALAGKDAT